MKKVLIISFISLFVSLSLFAQEKTMKLTLHLKNSLLMGEAALLTPDFREAIVLDDNKDGSIIVPLERPVYAILQVNYGKNRLYLEPGKDLDLTLIANEDGSFNFLNNKYEYRGPNAKINEYLSKNEVKLMENQDFLLDEEAYMAKLEKLEKENIKYIRKQKFPKEYEKDELLRVKYLLYEALVRYPIQHFWKDGSQFTGMEQYEETPKVKAYIPTLLIDSDELWENYAYRDFLRGAITILTMGKGFMTNDKNKDVVDCLNYLSEHFKSPKLLEDFTHATVIRYVESTEGKPLGEIEGYYNRFVKSEKYKKELADAQAVWAKLGAGTEVQSNDHKYQDINGKMIALEDLRGKYIYIDVWATWCGPCCAELPHLKTLEEKFEGKNIHFVSISMDSNKGAWVKKVQKDQLGGIQLIGGPEAQISKDYKIKAIPRFILLDREGKVINKDMTRPSDPDTIKTLEGLEGI